MAFWSEPENLIPKQSHRWVVSFDVGYAQERETDALPHYIFKSIDRPSFDVGTIQAKHLYSHTFNFPKRVTWKPIKVELNDVIIKDSKITIPTNDSYYYNDHSTYDTFLKSTESFIYSVLIKGGYFPINKDKELAGNVMLKSYTFKDKLSSAFFRNYSPNADKQITIKEIFPDGTIKESWILHNPFINNVNFGKLDYSSDNIITISFDIIYDWAELKVEEIRTNNNPVVNLDGTSKDRENIKISNNTTSNITGGGVDQDKKIIISNAGVGTGLSTGTELTPEQAMALTLEGKLTPSQAAKEAFDKDRSDKQRDLSRELEEKTYGDTLPQGYSGGKAPLPF